MSLPLNTEQLIEFISDFFGLDRDGLAEDLPLFSSTLLDSTGMVALVAYLEQETGLVVEADDLTLENFDTIASIAAFCKSRTR